MRKLRRIFEAVLKDRPALADNCFDVFMVGFFGNSDCPFMPTGAGAHRPQKPRPAMVSFIFIRAKPFFVLSLGHKSLYAVLTAETSSAHRTAAEC